MMYTCVLHNITPRVLKLLVQLCAGTPTTLFNSDSLVTTVITTINICLTDLHHWSIDLCYNLGWSRICKIWNQHHCQLIVCQSCHDDFTLHDAYKSHTSRVFKLPDWCQMMLPGTRAVARLTLKQSWALPASKLPRANMFCSTKTELSQEISTLM